MGKREWLLIGLIALCTALFFLWPTKRAISESTNSVILLPRIFSLQVADGTHAQFSSANEKETLYTIALGRKKVGTYKYTERQLSNGDVVHFHSFKNEQRWTLPMKLRIDTGEVKEVIRWDEEQKKNEHHPVFGVDPTHPPFGRIVTKAHEWVLMHPVESRILQSGESSIREWIRNGDAPLIEDGTITYDLNSKHGHILDFSYFSTNDSFFDDSEKRYVDWIHDEEMKDLHWLTADGPYTKLPFSIEPATELGFGRAIGRMQDDDALEWFQETEERYFETLLLQSRAQLERYNREFGGSRWVTEYTSTWLKNAYGVEAPYVDTRFNEYAAFFLDTLSKEMDDTPTTYVQDYAYYLLEKVEQGYIISRNDGFLIADYFDGKDHITHSSMNHALGGLKILLTAWDETKDETFLQTAEQLVRGFGPASDWIRDNGDLWYQLRPDGTFSGDDYPQLTLIDLIEVEALYESLGLPMPGNLKEMLESKLQFVQSTEDKLHPKVEAYVKKLSTATSA